MKVHLYANDQPLKPKAGVTAVCGAKLEKPAIVFTHEGDLRNLADVSALGTCLKCRGGELKGSYLYGVVETLERR